MNEGMKSFCSFIAKSGAHWLHFFRKNELSEDVLALKNYLLKVVNENYLPQNAEDECMEARFSLPDWDNETRLWSANLFLETMSIIEGEK